MAPRARHGRRGKRTDDAASACVYVTTSLYLYFAKSINRAAVPQPLVDLVPVSATDDG